MTRREEIRHGAINYANNQTINYSYPNDFDGYEKMCEESEIIGHFIAGAKYADKTILEKVYKWLDNINTDNYMDSGVFQMYDLIHDLRETMENNSGE